MLGGIVVSISKSVLLCEFLVEIYFYDICFKIAKKPIREKGKKILLKIVPLIFTVQAYKRVEEKDYKVKYEMNPVIKVDQKYVMAYTLLDEILNKALK